MATYIGTDANNNVTVQVEPAEAQTMLPNTGTAKFQDEIAQILETVTTYRGQPVVVTAAEDMTDETVIYLYMGDEDGYTANHWYYYDTENETWTDGGAYVANPVTIDDTLTQEGEAADAKATGDAIDDVKADLDQLKVNVSTSILEDASGSIATFTDGANDTPVKDLTISIEPVQSGSGDPSPENVRPISGWTGANVTRAGKNLLDESTYITSSSTSWQSFTLQLKPNTTYTYSVTDTGNKNRVLATNTNLAGNAYANTGSPVTFTTNDIALVTFGYYSSSSGTKAPDIEHQLELGSTATEYEPYKGHTYTIDWHVDAQTVYGGSLDVTTGVLTVDKAYFAVGDKTLSGYSASETGSYGYFSLDTNAASVATSTESVSAINSMGFTQRGWYYNTVGRWDGTNIDYGFSFSQLRKAISFYVRGVTTQADFESAIADFEVAYAIDPATYQLTPTEVKTILGLNNIWADTGDTNVTYIADTKMYIDAVRDENNKLRLTIAPIEDGDTASQAYAQGKYFYHSGDFCKAKTEIASGATFTLGTNYEVTTVAAELFNELNSELNS